MDTWRVTVWFYTKPHELPRFLYGRVKSDHVFHVYIQATSHSMALRIAINAMDERHCAIGTIEKILGE